MTKSELIAKLAGRYPQLVAKDGQQLDGVQPRVEDERDVDARGQLLEEAAADARLARADFPRELDEASALADAIDEMRQRLAVPRAHVEEARIRRDRERWLAQGEMREVHEFRPRRPLPRSIAPSGRPAVRNWALRGAFDR